MKPKSMCSCCIEHVEQHPFTLLDADGLAVTEHPAIDAEQVVADLEALGFLRRRRVRRLAHPLQLRERSAGQHVHRHVAAAAGSSPGIIPAPTIAKSS
jgi:hypothetical protein